MQQVSAYSCSGTCVISVIFLLAIDTGGNQIKNEILDAIISIVMVKTEQQLQHKTTTMQGLYMHNHHTSYYQKETQFHKKVSSSF